MENKIITIQINDYLTKELAEKIALTHYGTTNIAWVNRITEQIFDNKTESDCFHVIATNQTDDVVGRLYCIRNTYDENLWYYGDLFVAKNYRKNGIAEQMVKTAIQHLSNIGASTLRVYVASDNIPSLSLQKKLGFLPKEQEPFNNLLFDDNDLMFEKDILQEYTFLKIDANYLNPVLCLYMENRDELCNNQLSPSDLRATLSNTDKENYFICKGCMPIGWLCTQPNATHLLIEHLIVHKKYRHQGIGNSMLNYAISLAKGKSLNNVYIHTLDKNLAANRMATKNGFKKINSQNLGDDPFAPFIQYTYLKTI